MEQQSLVLPLPSLHVFDHIYGFHAWIHQRPSDCTTFTMHVGPIGHYFYHGMDKVVTRYFKIGTFGFVIAKVLGDELLFGPIHVGGYFAWMTLAEGGSWQVNTRVQLHQKLPNISMCCA